MKTFLALSALGILVGGCQSSGGPVNQSSHTWQSNQGTYAMDHVSQGRVEVTKAVQRSYLGEPYYFQNEENARKFDSKPSAYLYDDNSPERSSSPAMQGVRDR